MNNSKITKIPNGAKRRSDDDFKSPEKKDRSKGSKDMRKDKGKDMAKGKDKRKFADLVVQGPNSIE